MAEKVPRATVNVLVFLLLAGAVWATFGRALRAPFFYDDRAAFVENETIRQWWPLPRPLQPPPENPFSSRPLVNLTAAVNYHFGRLDPAGYRLVNMGFHAISAMLLFGIVGRTLLLASSPLARFGIGQSVAAVLAFVVALLWAVHPLQTETVCYVTQRTELMVGMFYLATLYCSLRYWLANTRPARIVWLASAVAACAAGMASKEVMVSAPLVVLLYEWTFLSRDLRKNLRQSWPLYVGLCLTWLLLAYLVAGGPRAKSAGFGLGLFAATWWLTQANVVVLYLKLAFWPWPLSIHYQIPYAQSLGDAMPALLIVGVLGMGTLVALWRGWAVGFLGAWFFVVLSPTSLVPIISEVAAERRMYLPLAAAVALVVVGGYWLAIRVTRRGETERQALAAGWAAALAVVATSLAVVLGAVSYERLAAYRTEVSIWQDALAQYPDSEVVQLCLAMALSDADRNDEAAERFAAAIRLEPMNLYHRVRFAEALKKAGKKNDAIAQLREVVLRRPDYVGAHYDLGLLLQEAGQAAEAAEHFAAAVKLRPKYAPYRLQYADALSGLGKDRDAISQFEEIVRLQPDSVPARDSLAKLLSQGGRWQQAADQWAAAVRLEPNHAELRSQYGNALRQLGQYPAAISQFRQAMELNPHARDPYFNLATAYAALGNHTEAIDQYERLLKLYPDDALGQAALGRLLMETGQYEPAVAHLRRAVELAPHAAENRHQLGAALLEIGRTDETIVELEQCVRLAPDSASGQLSLADAYAAAGRQGDALVHARRALDLAREQEDAALVEQVESWLSAHRVSE